MSVRKEDYHSPVENHWCPGCGNFGILTAVRRALVELDLPPQRVLICSGIGQAPKLPHYLRVNTLNGLHGRGGGGAPPPPAGGPPRPRRGGGGL
jgi:2-oxoglutarate ferredoxin oxidoreductase subunit beta